MRRRADGRSGMVEAVEIVYRPQAVYNFTVATGHTYFVGEGRWLVHNACEMSSTIGILACF